MVDDFPRLSHEGTTGLRCQRKKERFGYLTYDTHNKTTAYNWPGEATGTHVVIN